METSLGSNCATGLKELDSSDVFVLIDNVSDGMSSVPEGVTSEVPNLVKAGATAFTGGDIKWGTAHVCRLRNSC
jgi:7,8-dihydropterin-6-yl-methyl-4-(beta-D-ribofuranosyl)aminobenzene 5'-phosphate synthase